jgi:hypothetical protein
MSLRLTLWSKRSALQLTSALASMSMVGDVNLGTAAAVRTATISVGEGARLEDGAGGEVAVTAGSIASLTATVSAASSAYLSLASAVTRARSPCPLVRHWN